MKAFSFTSSTVEAATTTNKGISATKADHSFCKYRRQQRLLLLFSSVLIDIPELSALTHFYRSKSTSVFSCLTSSTHLNSTSLAKKEEHFSLAKKCTHTFFVTETIICCMLDIHSTFGIFSRNSCRWMRERNGCCIFFCLWFHRCYFCSSVGLGFLF